MSKEAFDKRIEALDALRSAAKSPATTGHLRKALKDHNNYFVSKAAAIVGLLELRTLAPDLLAAFDRFLTDPVKTDPQCWAKNAIAKALKDFEHDDAAVFLKGLAHFQLEPAWGGRSDTAATLRGACALALVGCRLDDLEILTHLGDALTDPEKPVRQDAARAIAQLSRPEGALLLRLKALLGDKEPEVVGQCFASLLSLAPPGAVAFIARFLESADADTRIEAAAALGESRQPEAIAILKRYWERWIEPELKSAVLMALGASPASEAREFLLAVLSEDPEQSAAEAIVALASSRHRAEVREQVAVIVAGRNHPKLKRVFDKEFSRA